MQAGSEVVFSNPAGTVVATSHLGSGVGESGSAHCSLPVDAVKLPGESFYKVTVNNHAQQTVSKEQLRLNDWTFELNYSE